MTLLSQAFRAVLAEQHGENKIYRGRTDKTWATMGVPQGGYVAGLILDSLMRLQQGSSHEDPLHLTTHFLKFLEQGSYEVHLQVVRKGANFTNLSATLLQKDEPRVAALAIFGVLAPLSEGERDITVVPPSRFAAPYPLHSHPAKCALVKEKPAWDFLPHLSMSRDPGYPVPYKRQNPSLELGHYFTLKDPADHVKTQSLPFFLDIYMSFAHLTLVRNKVDQSKLRPATLSFSVDFKFPIPKPDSPYHSSRTVAVFNKGQFVNDPFARHETYLEVWTAPTDITEDSSGGQRNLDVV